MQEAASNAERMLIKSPIEGIAVIKTTWKNAQHGGDPGRRRGSRRRPGRRRRESVDDARARAGEPGRHRRAAASARPYASASTPIRTCRLPARIDQISPIGVQSTLSPKVRNFIVLVGIDGAHPNLMPDLTASLDVELVARAGRARRAARRRRARGLAGLRPRAARRDASSGRTSRWPATNTHETVVTQGLTEGNVIARNIGQAKR